MSLCHCESKSRIFAVLIRPASDWSGLFFCNYFSDYKDFIKPETDYNFVLVKCTANEKNIHVAGHLDYDGLV